MQNKFLLIVMFFMHVYINGMALPCVSSQLNLSNGFITSIDEIEHLDDYKNITTIDLSKNRIRHFDIEKLLSSMPKLTTFIFSDNQITELRSCMLEGLPEDSYLDLSDNPIKKIESSVEHALTCLRDKKISITIKGTHLSATVLTSLTKSLERSSWAHLTTGIGLMVGGGITFVSSTVLMIVSDVDGDGQRNMGENIMFGSGLVGIFVGLGLCGAKQIVSCFQHDMRQSRLYWYQRV